MLNAEVSFRTLLRSFHVTNEVNWVIINNCVDVSIRCFEGRHRYMAYLSIAWSQLPDVTTVSCVLILSFKSRICHPIQNVREQVGQQHIWSPFQTWVQLVWACLSIDGKNVAPLCQTCSLVLVSFVVFRRVKPVLQRKGKLCLIACTTSWTWEITSFSVLVLGKKVYNGNTCLLRSCLLFVQLYVGLLWTMKGSQLLGKAYLLVTGVIHASDG